MTLLLLFISAAWVQAALSGMGLPVDLVDYLIVEFSTGQTVAEEWRTPQTASPGSLLKPFVALAYGRKNGLLYPEIECTGERCWLPQGHGRLGIEQAIAQSCNAYFRRLAQAVSPREVGFEASRLGLRAPPPNSSSEALWGLRSDWVATPQEILRSYIELVRRRGEPEASIVLRGLRRSARDGTAQALASRLSQDAYAKTGTAECMHAARGDGDGFAVAVYPADAPRYAVIVRVHDRTGRIAAAGAAAMLEALSQR